MHHVDVVVKLMHVTLPCAVISLNRRHNALVLNDPFGDRSSTSRTVEVVNCVLNRGLITPC